jgi:hypothetical protein
MSHCFEILGILMPKYFDSQIYHKRVQIKSGDFLLSDRTEGQTSDEGRDEFFLPGSQLFLALGDSLGTLLCKSLGLLLRAPKWLSVERSGMGFIK